MRGQPPQTAARRALRGVISLALRVFFRRIDRVGVERVPARGPVMFVLNHPNALVDPGIALISLPRPVSFLAKSTLFSIPVVSAMVRGVDSIPVARRQDSQGGAVDNTRTFAVAREVLQRGGSIAIFPEGVSHSAPQLKPLRTGAARIALGAGLTDLVIVPVGLDYANKHVFRSAALLYFGAPIQVEPIASGPLEAGVEPPREAVARLTARLERALADVVVQAEQAEALALADRAERILSSVAASAGAAARPAAGERFELRRRILEGYHELKERHRARVDQLVLRLEQHEDALRSVGLAGFGAGLDAGLDVGLDAGLDAPRPGRRVASLRAQAFGLALLAPFALLGAALHYPAYRLIGVLAVRFARDEDDMIATIKVLTAMLLFPVTWVAIGALAAVVTSAWRGVVIGSLAPLLGYAALLFFEALERLIGVMRVRLLSWRRRDRVEALRRERRWIHDELVALAQLVAASRGDPE